MTLKAVRSNDIQEVVWSLKHSAGARALAKDGSYLAGGETGISEINKSSDIVTGGFHTNVRSIPNALLAA